MATGAEHYREAERLLAIAKNYIGEDKAEERFARGMAAAAQVHATLAVAWATGYTVEDMPSAYYRAWGHLTTDDDGKPPCASCGEYGHEAGDCETILDDDLGQNHEDGDESRFTRAQLDGEACTECGAELAEGEPTVPSAYDFVEGQLLAHLRCAREAGVAVSIPAPRDGEQADGDEQPVDPYAERLVAAFDRFDAAGRALTGLRAFVAENPDTASMIKLHRGYDCVYIGHDPKHVDVPGLIAELALSAQRHGAALRTRTDDKHGGVLATFGPFEVFLYSAIDRVHKGETPVGIQLDPRLAAFGTGAES